MSNWNPTDRVLPDSGTIVEAMSSTGEVSELVFENGLWWLSDYSMYVYYKPEYWRKVEE